MELRESRRNFLNMSTRPCAFRTVVIRLRPERMNRLRLDGTYACCLGKGYGLLVSDSNMRSNILVALNLAAFARLIFRRPCKMQARKYLDAHRKARASSTSGLKDMSRAEMTSAWPPGTCIRL